MFEKHVVKTGTRDRDRPDPGFHGIQRRQEFREGLPAFLDDHMEALSLGHHIFDQRMGLQGLPHRRAR
jgi:hypothetical protein